MQEKEKGYSKYRKQDKHYFKNLSHMSNIILNIPSIMSPIISRTKMINLAQKSPIKHPPAINIIVHMFVYVCGVVSPLRTGHTFLVYT